MNKLIIIILFIFVSSTSFGKEITLNCKFSNGQTEYHSGVIDRELPGQFKKDNLFKFDESNKSVSVDDFQFFSGSEVSFSQDLVKSKKEFAGLMIESFSLNRLTGDLFRRIYFVKDRVTYTLNYKCSQVGKKLF